MEEDERSLMAAAPSTLIIETDTLPISNIFLIDYI